jgi:hypothetical protein
VLEACDSHSGGGFIGDLSGRQWGVVHPVWGAASATSYLLSHLKSLLWEDASGLLRRHPTAAGLSRLTGQPRERPPSCQTATGPRWPVTFLGVCVSQPISKSKLACAPRMTGPLSGGPTPPHHPTSRMVRKSNRIAHLWRSVRGVNFSVRPGTPIRCAAQSHCEQR